MYYFKVITMNIEKWFDSKLLAFRNRKHTSTKIVLFCLLGMVVLIGLTIALWG